MKKLLGILALSMIIMSSCSNENKAKDNSDYIVTIQTTFGDMKVILYDETPLHKANFIKLAESGQYDSTTWHRIIEKFMVQGGGIDMKDGTNNQEKIDAEIKEGFFHHKGALAAARQGDQVNPEKKSSWCQFYIVQGEVYDSAKLAGFENQMNQGKKNKLFGEIVQRPENADLLSAAREYQKEQNRQALDSVTNLVMEKVEAEYTPAGFSDEQKEIYTSVGGAPHLDNEYTVFGKVVEGIDVIDRLAAVETASRNKPVVDVYLTMTVDKLSKKKITKLYGYEYP